MNKYVDKKNFGSFLCIQDEKIVMFAHLFHGRLICIFVTVKKVTEIAPDISLPLQLLTKRRKIYS